MDKKVETLENELNDLRQSLENFQQEKERVRLIIGKVGGIPHFRTKLVNILFIAIVAISVVVSVLAEKHRLLMIELATVTLSIKIIYLIHCQMRVNHFKLWILSAIEWRINEMMGHIKHIRRTIDESPK